ncbi:MAG: IS21 family transposase [Tissierellia bacterium]|nr:IS21 family transposase [Tissierellia bacterium]
MKDIMDKHAIIRLKQEGVSNREVARLLGINRKTVARYWNAFNMKVIEIELAGEDEIALMQEELLGKPKYNATNRARHKYTDEIDKLLDEILEEEKEKDKNLGTHRQNLTQLQIHKRITDAGYDISKSTIALKVKEKRNKSKECFIKQIYDFADRLEYDFGEVKLLIDGKKTKFYMAVFSSPASNFRWAYLYKNQKQEVFMDSHVRFFHMLGGVFKEVVYDNMKNVVTKFIGRSEKLLNENLLALANYYGFKINVTNCFKGNEKGHVENSVKTLRNQIFAEKYIFASLENAREYLEDGLINLNEASKIEEEKQHLLPVKPKLALGKINQQTVNSYSFVQVEKNFYSVPDYLVGREVTTRVYPESIKVYSCHKLVCSHRKVDGVGQTSIDIKHYLSSLAKKPGALRNSLALKSIPELKSIYDKHFTKNPRLFIEILTKNQNKSIEEIIEFFKTYKQFSFEVEPLDLIPSQDSINKKAVMQMSQYSSLCLSAEREVANGY